VVESGTHGVEAAQGAESPELGIETEGAREAVSGEESQAPVAPGGPQVPAREDGGTASRRRRTAGASPG
jgi:hypothetical protein